MFLPKAHSDPDLELSVNKMSQASSPEEKNKTILLISR